MSNPQCSFRLSLVATVVSGLLCAGAVNADALDTWNVSFDHSMTYDRNLFHLSDSANTQALLGTSQRSDVITADTLGLKINKPYSLQRFELDLNLARYNYRKFEYLNFTAVNYAAAWRWSLTPSLSGNLTSNRTQAMNNFVDSLNYRNSNIRTDEQQRFDADLDLSAGWHLLAGVVRNVRKNSAEFLQERDNTLTSAELGGRYDFPSGTSVGLVTRSGRGTYDNQGQPSPATLQDNGFVQTENTLVFNWPVTGKTDINARIGHLARRNDHYGARDFSGTVGSLNMNWAISGKSRLSAGVTRNLSSYETVSSSYSSIDRFYFSPVWQISTRTALRFRYDYIRQDYLGAIAPGPGTGRSDKEQIALLAVDWQPMTSLSLSASLTDDRRTSNQTGRDFKDTIAQVSVQLLF